MIASDQKLLQLKHQKNNGNQDKSVNKQSKRRLGSKKDDVFCQNKPKLWQQQRQLKHDLKERKNRMDSWNELKLVVIG